MELKDKSLNLFRNSSFLIGWITTSKIIFQFWQGKIKDVWAYDSKDTVAKFNFLAPFSAKMLYQYPVYSENLDKMTFKPLSSKKKKSNIYFSPFRQATKVHSPPPPLPKCEEAKKRPLTPDNSWVPNKCCHYWPRDRAMVLKAWNLFLFSL